MRSKSIKGNSVAEIETAIKDCLADGFSPTLSFVFLSIHQDRDAICELLHLEGIDIAGATPAGEFINGYEGEGSIVILLLDLNRSCYSLLFEDCTGKDPGETAAQLATAALAIFKRPGFILCTTGLSKDIEYLDGEPIVYNIENVIGPQVNIYGGMAGDDLTLTGTYVFTYGQSTDKGMMAVALDEDKVSLQGMAISGWKPIGISRTVTKSNGAWIYTIDDKPALEMYLKYLGKDPVDGEDKYKIFEEIGVHYPLQVEREKGEPVMRTPMAINAEEKALLCDFNVPQGSRLRFSMPPDFDIVDKVKEQAMELKYNIGIDAEALLIFSCSGRQSALGPMAKMENQELSKIWNAPMAGFYSYGEYGRAINGKQEFHSTTCCWVVLKEL